MTRLTNQYTCESGDVIILSIPENATKNDLLGLKEFIEVIMERHFKFKRKEE